MDKPLVNRVAKSGLITINLEDYFPQSEIVEFDLKDFLFRELLLREKDFRAAMKEIDWSAYEGKQLAVFCSTDAIIPTWAYQLVVVYAEPFADQIYFGGKEELIRQHYYNALAKLNPEDYQDQRIVIKGCSDQPVPVSAYMELTRILRPVAKTIMFGEPCSTVPLYKQPKK
jgi:hypothetical protein